MARGCLSSGSSKRGVAVGWRMLIICFCSACLGLLVFWWEYDGHLFTMSVAALIVVGAQFWYTYHLINYRILLVLCCQQQSSMKATNMCRCHHHDQSHCSAHTTSSCSSRYSVVPRKTAAAVINNDPPHCNAHHQSTAAI